MTLKACPAVAPNPPGHTFAFAYRPTAGSEKPLLFVPIGYPRPNDGQMARATAMCDHTGRVVPKQRFVTLRRDDTGGWVNISEGELADYLGDPVAAAMLLLWVSLYEQFVATVLLERPKAGRDHFGVEEVIETALNVMRVRGWVSRGTAHKQGTASQATASHVLDVLEDIGRDPDLQAELKALEPGHLLEDHDRAKEIVAWLRRMYADPRTELSDYLHNLAVTATYEWVRGRSVGLLCSAPGAFEDWKRIEATRAKTRTADTGQHFGTPDSRVEADVFVDDIEDKGENEWGRKLLVSLHIVPTGEVLKWWTGEGLKLDKGKQYHVRLTVLKHDVWDGQRQTTVNRVSEFTPPPPKVTKPRGKKAK